jgi:molybdopterin-guanine dinucleotide biosynthesis protein B
MRVAAITGWSGSGKTTLIVASIARLVAQGVRVAAIKHTHHPLNDRDEGDTARFRAAGAHPVILASDGEAVVFAQNATRVVYNDPRDLLAHLNGAEVVLVEGFKSYNGWPRIEAGESTVGDVLAILGRIPAP